jgi:hypothetical protein
MQKNGYMVDVDDDALMAEADDSGGGGGGGGGDGAGGVGAKPKPPTPPGAPGAATSEGERQAQIAQNRARLAALQGKK